MKFFTPKILHDKPDLNDLKNRYSAEMVDTVYNVYMRSYHRTILSEAQNHRCCWCGTRMTEISNQRTTVTIEHVIPVSKGGSDDLDNCVASCARCNSWRGSLPVDSFMKIITNAMNNPPKIGKKSQLRDELRKKGIVVSKKTSVGKMNRKLRHLEITKTITNNSGNIYEPGSKEHNKYQDIKAFEELKKEILANDTNIYEPGSKNFKLYEHLKNRDSDRKTKSQKG